MAGGPQRINLPGSGRVPAASPAGPAHAPVWSWGGAEWGLLAFLLPALLALSPIGHVVGIIALITVIGIPIYFLVAALPSLFLLYLFGYLLWRARTCLRNGHMFAGAIFAALALLMADFFVFSAWRANSRVDAKAAALMAADNDLIGTASAIFTLAVVRTSRNSRDADNVCDDICQRLLLTGAVKKVIAITLAPPAPEADTKKGNARKSVTASRAETPWPEMEINDALTGIVYSLEQRGSCPAFKVPENVRTLSLPQRAGTGRGVVFEREVRAPEALRLKLASGICLISAPATLAQADAALTYGTVESGRFGMGRGYDMSSDPLSAWRHIYHSRIAGNMLMLYRSTGVRYERFPGALIPSIIHGSEFRTGNGYMRYNVQLGERKGYQDSPAIENFVINRLGLKLAIDPADGPKAQGGAIDRILGAPQPGSDLNSKIAADYMGQISQRWGSRNAPLEEEDAQRILRIAGDMQIEVPFSMASAAALIAEKSAQHAPELARLLFMRLAAVPDQPPEGQARGSWNDAVNRISNSLALLPDSVLRPYRGEIELLGRNRTKRAAAEFLLNRLDLFGPEIVPVLFYLMEDAVREGEEKSKQSRDGNWTRSYRVGLNGLCKLGEKVSFALPQLNAFVEGNKEISKRHYSEFTMTTLARLGASESDIRARMLIDASDTRAEQSFQRALRNASGTRPCN